MIDASKLPTEPAVLAQELDNGTTGIPLLRSEFVLRVWWRIRSSRSFVNFGPTVGISAAFYSYLFDAMAKLKK